MKLPPPTGKIYWDEFVEWDIKVNKMKAYTDLEQSKKLAEILPLESADMHYSTWTIVSEDGDFIVSVSQQGETIEELQKEYGNQIIPCWSLTALLNVLQKAAYFIDEDANVVLSSYKTVEWNLGINNSDVELVTESNPVDACYEIIIKLYEQKIL